MEPDKLLFVGLNPSHDQKDNDLMAIQVGHGSDPLPDERALVVTRHDEESMGLHGGKLHKYFRQFPRFGPDGTWNHIDLLAVRLTSQEQMIEAMKLEEETGRSSSFVREQIDLAFSLMTELRPPVVVVVNAFGSCLVKKYLEKQNPEFAMDQETGFYWSAIGGQRVPTFFSGMVTGRRAIDNHSLERLIWHVRQALAYKVVPILNGTK
jgi:hypothetical protein